MNIDAIQISPGLLLSLLAVVASLSAWLLTMRASIKRTETQVGELKKKAENVIEMSKATHKLLEELQRDSRSLMRELHRESHGLMRELIHYIRFIAKQSANGKPVPPPEPDL